MAESCERFVRDVEEVSAEASGWQRPITVGAGEVVIREFLIPKIGKQRKWKQPVSWVMRNLPGIDHHQQTFQLGWNRKVAERRPEVAKLVKALGGLK
ncbi:MAG: hypothetical protein RLZZ282_703 [Verrucomicrobiota bacterium]